MFVFRTLGNYCFEQCYNPPLVLAFDFSALFYLMQFYSVCYIYTSVSLHDTFLSSLRDLLLNHLLECGQLRIYFILLDPFMYTVHSIEYILCTFTHLVVMSAFSINVHNCFHFFVFQKQHVFTHQLYFYFAGAMSHSKYLTRNM